MARERRIVSRYGILRTLNDVPLSRISRRDRLIETAVLVAAFVAAILIIDPRGEFPLNDDWNFGMSTWHFAAHGTFRFARLTGMTLKLQVLWGALWTVLFGRSFFVLRLSTLTLSLGTLLIVHALAIRLNLSRFWRLVAPLSLLANPFFLWASVTFMTHVPFIFLTAVALYAYYRAFSSDEVRWLVLASLAVVGSFFIRQTGIAVACAAAAYLVLQLRWRDARWWKWFVITTAPLVLFVFLFLFTHVLEGYPGQIKEHYEMWQAPNTKTLLYRAQNVAWHWTYFTFQYAAISFLPLAIPLLTLVRIKEQQRFAAWLVLSGIGLSLATFLSDKGLTLPYRTHGSGNIIANLAFGPLTLRDIFVFDRLYPSHLPFWATSILSHVAALLGATILWLVIRSAWKRSANGGSPQPVALFGLHALIAIVLLWISGVYFDRYTIDCLWTFPLIASWWLAPALGSGWRAAITALLVATAILSAFGLQEYFRWNRVRWDAFAFLTSRGVALRQMDGGYEINQYLLGGWDGPFNLKLDGASVVDDEYILTFSPVKGWREIARFPYSGFLGMRRGAIHVLRRDEAYSPLHRYPIRKREYPVLR